QLLIKGFGFHGLKIHWHGVMIANAFIEDPLDFADAEVEHSFWLEGSILQGRATFRGSWFKKDLLLSEAKFEAEADFERVKVEKSLFMRGAIYYGPVSFIGADIKGNFEAIEAQFLHENAKANFNSMKVGHTAHFSM